jgi:hypothetical protein
VDVGLSQRVLADVEGNWDEAEPWQLDAEYVVEVK